MNKSILMGFIASMVMVSNIAIADEKSVVGMGFDVGAPDGLALGIVGRIPSIPVLKAEVAGTYALSEGIRGSLIFDPFRSPVSVILALDAGHMFPGKIPFFDKSPMIQYNYMNLQPGLTFGSRDGFRFFIRGGVSWISGSISDTGKLFELSNGVSMSDPTFSVRIVPSAKLGFVAMF
jgi:hypothetical protein